MARLPLRWVDLLLPRKSASKHFLCAGAAGSGKTTLIRCLIWSIVQSDEHFRALSYDGKTEDVPFYFGMLGVTEEQVRRGTSRVKILHPFDVRGAAWDLARDIAGPRHARQFAAITISGGAHAGEAEEFFLNAVRDLKTGVLLALKNCAPNPDSFEYRDVLLALTYPAYLRFIMGLKRTRDGQPFLITQRLKQAYLDGDRRLLDNIVSSANAKLGGLEGVAACWYHSVREGRQPFSLSRWVEDDGDDILILGNDEAARAVIDPLNQAIFNRAAELLLARREATPCERETGENQTFFFLDEIREAGRLDMLGRLLTKSRSKNGAVCLGFQSIEGMREVYGGHVANDLTGQCSHVAILRLNDGSTAEWAVEMFGEHLDDNVSDTQGTDSDGNVTRSIQSGMDDRTWLYTSDFLYLPEAGPENGIWGYVRVPQLNPQEHDLWFHLSWDEIQANLPPVGDATGWRAPFIPRPEEHHYLRPWDAADWARLGFPGEPPDWEDDGGRPVPPPDGPPAPAASAADAPPVRENPPAPPVAPRAFPGLRPISWDDY